MSGKSTNRVQEVFLAACEKSPDERPAFLMRACGKDEALRREVESLLSNDHADDSFLNTPALVDRFGFAGPDAGAFERDSGDDTSNMCAPPSTVVRADLPTHIGHYRIVDVLGEGGMGVVYRAEQENPRRTVALKVIRPGAESRELLKRFAHESQVLGSLQHPGIAQVFEAGTASTENGVQPFFAMEFVDGRSLNEYVRDTGADTASRLGLMIKVCDAVQHAHQKGVIHRDLKPGNIMVDPTGQPKILDFGVARATDADVRTTTLQTDAGKLVGTIAYMSPEQIAGEPQDLDTRSDVYALGVITYELLAGRHPHDVTNKTIPQVARLITEEEATHLSSFDRLYRGDIDTIVSKALEKDKNRRYQSASSMALDLRHHLADQPITARPATTLYQLQKFARRNTALVASVAIAFVVLAGALVRMTSERNRSIAAERLAEARRVEAERHAATLEVVSNFLHYDLLQAADPKSGRSFDATVRSVLDRASENLKDRFVDEPIHEAALRSTLGTIYKNIGVLEMAETHTSTAWEMQKNLLGEEKIETLNTATNMAQIYKYQGRFEDAYTVIEPTVKSCRRVWGDTHRVTLNAMASAAIVLKDLGRLAEAEDLFLETLDLQRRHLGNEDSGTLTTMNNLASAYQAGGRLQESIELLRETLPLNRRILGENHPDTLQTTANLGMNLKQLGHFDEAYEFLIDAHARQESMYGEDHPSTLHTANSLALLLMDMGEFERAEVMFLATLEGRRRVFGDDNHLTLQSLSNVSNFYRERGRFAEAEPIAVEVMERYEVVSGPDSMDAMGAKLTLAHIYVKTERFEKAERFASEVLEQRRRILGEDHPKTLTAGQMLSIIYRRQGRLDKAEPLMKRNYDLKCRKLGEEHPNTLNSANNFANLLAQMERYDEAETLHRHTLARRRRVLGESHPRTYSSIGNLGEVFYLQDDFEQAEPLFRQSYRGNLGAYGPIHWRTVEGVERLAATLIALGRIDEAISLLEESLTDSFDAVSESETLAPAITKRLALLERCGAGELADRFRMRLNGADVSHAGAVP